MLLLEGRPVELLWDEVLPIESRLLAAGLAVIDRVLDDPAVLAPIAAHWQREAEQRGRATANDGRPTIAMATYVRLMVVKQRNGYGYERLVREVCDSLHLRCFCRIGLGERLPDESTIRKLTRRLGPDVVADLTRAVIAKGVAETRFRARAVRIDSTVVEADVRYPTDAGRAGDAVRLLAREGKRAAALIANGAGKMRDRTRAVGRKLRELGVAVKRRSGEAKDEILRLTGECGHVAAAAVRDARRLAKQLRQAARGGARRPSCAPRSGSRRPSNGLRRCASRSTSGWPASRSLTGWCRCSTSTPGRSARARRASRPNSGQSIRSPRSLPTRARGARGFVLPPATAPGNPGEEKLLPATVTELQRLGLTPAEVAVDAGFPVRATQKALEPLDVERLFIAGKRSTAAGASKRTRDRLASYRTGSEGRISHLKRDYSLRRSRLNGAPGTKTWVACSALTYNLDTYVHYAVRRD